MWRYNEYAQVHPIGERLWAIDEIGKTILYLYEGDERVLLVDTGFGLLDLKKLAGELCPGKELLVVNTHAPRNASLRITPSPRGPTPRPGGRSPPAGPCRWPTGT